MAIGEVKLERPKSKGKSPSAVRGAPSPASTIRVVGPGSVSIPAPAAERLTAPQQKVVDSLAFWVDIGQSAPSRAQVAAAAGRSAKCGGFNNLLSQLASVGVISYPAPGSLSLERPDAANVMDAETAKQKMMASLSSPERKVLGAFNGFNNLLSSLSSVGIVTRPAPGMVDLADWVREIL